MSIKPDIEYEEEAEEWIEIDPDNDTIQEYDKEYLDPAAGMVVAYMFGCRCGDCWGPVSGRSRPSCLSVVGAAMVSKARDRAEAVTDAQWRQAPAPPPDPDNLAHWLLAQPRVWRTVEAVAWILTHGYVDRNGYAREPEAIDILLRRAELPRLEGGVHDE